MRRPTPWVREECIQSDSLPAECDVVIVGGGLSGLACGRFLAAGGADVVVLEAGKRLGQGAVGRGNGLVHLGLCEHPIQLAEAIGNRDAEDVIRLSLRSIELLESSCSFLTEGGIWCASMDREAKTRPEVRQSHTLQRQANNESRVGLPSQRADRPH